ncbi:MAG: FimV/HubP family polar landmark protein [Marinobacter sp.]|uniref:FimV/HubP family polar landmark protein n=1 Tax=Marinobacter sp. TaxID=50741 RepID=UPI00299EE5DA|nr:FimV/HubP family polar landmark protein [Marinobacter sp.]MDX1754953.1 FimV/HubP family polar landmark protein [Marinobacter sp.]
MKVRKLAVALALAGGLGSGVAQALGLGEIELQSYLNEPLEADISLSSSAGVSPSEVFVNLAPNDAFRQVGIDRSFFLSKLQFNVVTAPDGNLMVNVSTSEPVKEPYLNFLLEVTWPNGRLMREYAVLVDPPVYAEESGLTEQVSAPQTAAPSQPVPEPAAPVTQQAPEREVPSAPAPSQPRQAVDSYGPTGASDTLWSIASQVRPSTSVTHQQVMLAIQDLNPDAFMGGNINRLKRGQILRVPTLEQIQSRTRAEANQQVTAQNEALASRPERTVDARDVELAPDAAEPTEAAGTDELKLLVADDQGERSAEDGGSAGGDSQLAGGVDAGTAVAMEELESARRENEELSGRVEDLQAQVETLQRLLELKNSQLAEMEQGLTAADQAEPGQPVTEGGMAADAVAPSPETPDSAAEDADVAALTGEPSAEEAADQGLAPEEPEAGLAADGDTMAAEDGAEVDESTAVDAGEPDAMAQAQAPALESGADVMAPAPEAPAPSEARDQPVQAQPAPEVEEKGFPANIIDLIMRNPMYQVGLGGGLIVLLLLLLLVARRNANKEQEFYAQLEAEGGADESDDDSIALKATSAEPDEEEVDPLAEADTYIAYGRLDQAAQSLEAAISREPSRSDLRVKLLGVYADAQNRSSFDKQFGELEALEDNAAIAEAHALRARLDEAEEMPSIDDLESELMSDSFSAEAPEEPAEAQGTAEPAPVEEDMDEAFAEFDLDQAGELESTEAAEGAKDEAIEFDLSDLGLDEEKPVPGVADHASEAEDAQPEQAESSELEELGAEFELEESGAEQEVEFDMDLGDLDETLEVEPADSAESAEEGESLEDDFASLDLDEELSEPEQGEAPAELAPVQEEGLGSLDESFLDELDAELDKVAGEEGEDLSEELAEEGLEDLELDVSDEDLALIEQAADLGEVEPKEETAEGDVELDIDDLSLDELSDSEPETQSQAEPEQVPSLEEEIPTADELAPEPEAEEPVEAEKAGYQDIDESDLGDDDDFDFLAGTDEAATKLDLARAYIEMGDADGARDILEEVAIEGDDQQKAEAQDLLKTLS